MTACLMEVRRTTDHARSSSRLRSGRFDPKACTWPGCQIACVMMLGLIAPSRRIKDGVASMACDHLGVVASNRPAGQQNSAYATSDESGTRTHTVQQLSSPVLPIELPHHQV